jgi:hypothetical protein
VNSDPAGAATLRYSPFTGLLIAGRNDPIRTAF